MKSIQIVGPFASNYSFARVNRGLAKALSEISSDLDVKLFQEEDKFDKKPGQSEMQSIPYLDRLWQRERKKSDFVIYNDFPKGGIVKHGLKKLPGKIKMAYFAWEESVYPEIWVKEINENLHALLVSATFVRDIMRNAGVRIPILVVHNAIDDEVRNLEPNGEFPLKTEKKIKFLNISTGRQRKGIDVLIKAYFNSFTRNDDVCLILKSFPGPDNMINNLLAELETESTPEVEHIMNPDLSEQDLVNLISLCDVGVYPTRAEGFGLPIAESMYRERPVIVTNYSAYLDFANESNSYLIDYELTDTRDSEMVNIGAKWAEPDEKQLGGWMRYLYSLKNGSASDIDKVVRKYQLPITSDPKEDYKMRLINAKESAESLSWKNSAEKVLKFLPKVEKFAELKNKKAAVISFMNNEDGIAVYTKNLYSLVEKSFDEFFYLANTDISDRVQSDEANIIRNWESGTNNFNELYKWIGENHIDLIHIQYHSGINFLPEMLNSLILELSNKSIKTCLTLHAVQGTDFDLSLELTGLGKADAVFVHHKGDAEYLSNKFDNIIHYPLPRIEFKKRNSKKVKSILGLDKYETIICTHGLFNQNKCIPAMIEAFAEVLKKYPNALFLGLNAISSNNISAQAEYESTIGMVTQKGIEDNVIFVTDFLSNEQVELLVQSADINVLAYKESGESASAAVDKFLASGNPTIVSKVKAFDVFKDEVIKVDPTPEKIAEAIFSVINDKKKSTQLTNAALRFIKQNSYEVKSVEMLEIYSEKLNLLIQ